MSSSIAFCVDFFPCSSGSIIGLSWVTETTQRSPHREQQNGVVTFSLTELAVWLLSLDEKAFHQSGQNFAYTGWKSASSLSNLSGFGNINPIACQTILWFSICRRGFENLPTRRIQKDFLRKLQRPAWTQGQCLTVSCPKVVQFGAPSQRFKLHQVTMLGDKPETSWKAKQHVRRT